MFESFVTSHIVLVAIIIYILLLSYVVYLKPHYFYNNDGSLKQFGVGYQNKTILPIWLFCIILGIFAYLAVLYYKVYVQFS
jgi:hypothetical protein